MFVSVAFAMSGSHCKNSSISITKQLVIDIKNMCGASRTYASKQAKIVTLEVINSDSFDCDEGHNNQFFREQ